jgi:RNA polymerase sigma factor (sigma-70 family)
MNCTDPHAAALIALKNGNPSERDDAICVLMPIIVSAARRTVAEFCAHRFDVDDFAQAALIQIVQLADKYEHDPTRRAAALVYCVARRTSLTAAQRLAKQRPLNVLSLQQELFRGGVRKEHHTVADALEDPNAPDPLEQIATAQDARRALQLIYHDLSLFERRVWVGKYVYGREYGEIAAALSVGRKTPYTIKNVDNALSRAKRKLARNPQTGRIRDSSVE